MSTLKTYEAHVIPAQPGCTDRGCFYEVTAINAYYAKQAAREENRREGTYGRPDGRLIVTVRRVEG